VSDPVVWLEVSGTDIPKLPVVARLIEPREGGAVVSLEYTHKGACWVAGPDPAFCLVSDLGVSVPIHGMGNIFLADGDTLVLTSELSDASMKALGLET